MEIVGWITIILLCALALIFIALELGPVISTEITSWKIRKQKALEAREDKARFKSEMKKLKRKVKKLNYMKKKGLDTSELELGLQSPCLYENNMGVEKIEIQENVVDYEDNKDIPLPTDVDAPPEVEPTYIPTNEELNMLELMEELIPNNNKSDDNIKVKKSRKKNNDAQQQ